MERNAVQSKLVVAFALMASAAFQGRARAQHYLETDLVANQPGGNAKIDKNLVNGWGLARSSTSPWWVSDNGVGLTTLYDASGTASSLVVTVPGAPTGTVFNGSQDFALAPQAPARFLFASEDGTISGWNPSVDATHAKVMITTAGAVYKGLALATVDGKQRLYAADFHNNRIDVFDAQFHKIDQGFDGELGYNFVTHLRGLAPFNIQNIAGNLVIAFAKQDDDKEDEVAGAGLGMVAAFTPVGRIVRMFQHVNDLNAPWGMALAPGDFGVFSHHLLVGQFGSGEILAFNPITGTYAGKLLNAGGQPLVIEGLWGIGFGNDKNAGPATTLFFAAGPGDEKNGLFGSLVPTPSELTQGNGN